MSNNSGGSLQPPLAPVIIISGPSGVGKSTVLRQLLHQTKLPLRLSISATTRNQRPGERDGVHYYFWDRDHFEREIAAGSFLEHALVHQKHYYGTPKSEVEPYLPRGIGVILDIDVQGADQVRQVYPDAYSIFLIAPDFEARLRERQTEDEEAIQRRLESARLELERASEYNALLTNFRLEETVQQLEDLIAERFPPRSDSCSTN